MHFLSVLLSISCFARKHCNCYLCGNCSWEFWAATRNSVKPFMDIHIILSLQNELPVFVTSDFQNIKSDIFEHLWRDKILVSAADGIPSDKWIVDSCKGTYSFYIFRYFWSLRMPQGKIRRPRFYHLIFFISAIGRLCIQLLKANEETLQFYVHVITIFCWTV